LRIRLSVSGIWNTAYFTGCVSTVSPICMQFRRRVSRYRIVAGADPEPMYVGGDFEKMNKNNTQE
jgi:hypothetical protein